MIICFNLLNNMLLFYHLECLPYKSLWISHYYRKIKYQNKCVIVQLWFVLQPAL